MAISQVRILIQKDVDGTLTDSERLQLHELMRENLRKWFEICPSCGGAFSLDLSMNQPFPCPWCDVSLTSWSADIVGHDASEIDPSQEANPMLGEFWIGYRFPGVLPCLRCGILYPKGYCCCPKLVGYAADYFTRGDDTEKLAAVDFIKAHSDTVLNVLRSRFLKLLSSVQIDALHQISQSTDGFLDLRGQLELVRRQTQG